MSKTLLATAGGVCLLALTGCGGGGGAAPPHTLAYHASSSTPDDAAEWARLSAAEWARYVHSRPFNSAR